MRARHRIPPAISISPLAVATLLATSSAVHAQFPQGPEYRVNTYTTGAQRRPAACPAGFPWGDGFVVAWESDGQDGDQDGIFAQEHDWSGTPLGPEFRVNTYTTSSQHGVSVEFSVPGLVFVWQSEGQDGDLGGVFAQRWKGGPIGGEFRVNSYTTSIQGAPAVGADGTGNFVVVWASLGQDGSDSGIFGQRYASSGAPLGGEFQVNSYTTGFQGHPSVGKDSQTGAFMVMWEGQGAGDQPFGIYAQRYSADGTPAGGEFRVNSFTTGDQRYPRVNALAGGGGFSWVWESDGQDGSGPGVFIGDFQVNTYTTGAQNRPALWWRWFNNLVVVWQSDDNQDPGGGIFGQFFYGPGGPIGSEFRVNTYTTGTQDEPAVTRKVNDVVVTWSSEQDPDGSRGIYAQRYNAPWLPVELQDFTVK